MEERHLGSFNAARVHFRRVETAFERLRRTTHVGGSGRTERAAFLAEMNAFRRHADQLVVETQTLLARRRQGVDGPGR
jgi:hypothetical protein